MIWPFSLTQTDIDQVEHLVADLKRHINPDLTANKTQALSVNKTTRVVERIIKSFQAYDETRKLSYFARVRFFHQLEWKLRDAGYSKEFVDLILESLLMSRRKGQSTSKS
jgi:hypothetical protein